MIFVNDTSDRSKNMSENYTYTVSNDQRGVYIFQIENFRAGSVGACRIRKGNSNKKLPDFDKNISIDKDKNLIINKLMSRENVALETQFSVGYISVVSFCRGSSKSHGRVWWCCHWFTWMEAPTLLLLGINTLYY